MTLESVYYIGQSVAVVAILVSLYAIYRQQRRTNEIERGKTEAERANQLSEFVWNHTKDHETLQSLRQCLHNHDHVHPDDQAKFMAYMTNVMELMGQAFYQQKHDLIASTSYDGVTNFCLANLKTPGGRQWWEASGKILWQADLTSYISKQLDDPNNSVPPVTDIMKYLRLLPEGLGMEQPIPAKKISDADSSHSEGDD